MQTFPKTGVVVTGIFGDQCVNWNHHLAESSGRGSLPTSKWQSNYTVQDHWGKTARCPSLNFTGETKRIHIFELVKFDWKSWCKSKQTIYVNKHMNLMSPNMITVNPWNRVSERNMLNHFERLYTWHPSHQTCRAHPMSPETVPCGPAELNPWIET